MCPLFLAFAASLGCTSETQLTAMHRAEANGDAATARAIAVRLSTEGDTLQRLSALRLLQRQREFAVVATGAEEADRTSTSDADRTALLEVRTGALLALGRHDDAVVACRASVAQLPQQPLRHLYLAQALASTEPDQALTEVREAILLLPAWDRVEQIRDEAGRLTTDRYYKQALDLYAALQRKTAPPAMPQQGRVLDAGVSP